MRRGGADNQPSRAQQDGVFDARDRGPTSSPPLSAFQFDSENFRTTRRPGHSIIP